MALIVPAPAAGFKDHSTATSVLVPPTVALNCWVLFRSTIGVPGVTSKTDSFEVMVALVTLDLRGSAWLVAFT